MTDPATLSEVFLLNSDSDLRIMTVLFMWGWLNTTNKTRRMNKSLKIFFHTACNYEYLWMIIDDLPAWSGMIPWMFTSTQHLIAQRPFTTHTLECCNKNRQTIAAAVYLFRSLMLR
jgi:hypothetical protein